MASGLFLRRIQRPDTWQLRPATCRKSKPLAKPEPSTHGAIATPTGKLGDRQSAEWIERYKVERGRGSEEKGA
tara:strand:- start:13 stop:231 length:219 start_codon:yes stop_codon:yes gene_type:complete